MKFGLPHNEPIRKLSLVYPLRQGACTPGKVSAMSKLHLTAVPGVLFALSFMGSGSPALAATPHFTITATNVTMSSNGANGVGTSTTTLTSVNDYSGSVRVVCISPTLPAGVKAPYCNGAIAPPPITLSANQVVTGSIGFYTCSGIGCPVSLPLRRGHRLAQGLSLAGALLFGFGLRRRPKRWLTLILLGVGSLAGLAGISACGGGSAMTPGTYTYTITATDINSAVSVSTSIDVTVP